MSVLTLLKFLFGNADAIRTVSGSTDSLTIGALFVFSAGLARTWHRKNLQKEPWHLLLPFAASLLSALIFTLAFSVWWSRSLTGFTHAFLPILRAFWMTAPLAWLYAIPFERNRSREVATKNRMWALLVVATWRVALMVRVLCVVFAVPASLSTLFVLAYGTIVALLAMIAARPKEPESVPVVLSVMGGMSPNTLPVELKVARGVTGCLIPLFGAASVLLVPALILQSQNAELTAKVQNIIASGDLWSLAVGSIGFFIGMVFWFSGRHKLQSTIDDFIAREKFTEAINVLTGHDSHALPWQWRPPLADVWHGRSSDKFFGLSDAAEAVVDLPDWVREFVAEARDEFLSRPILWWFDDEQTERVATRFVNWSVSPEAAAATLQGIDLIHLDLDTMANVDRSDEEANDHARYMEERGIIHNVPPTTASRTSIIEELNRAAEGLYEFKGTDDE